MSAYGRPRRPWFAPSACPFARSCPRPSVWSRRPSPSSPRSASRCAGPCSPVVARRTPPPATRPIAFAARRDPRDCRRLGVGRLVRGGAPAEQDNRDGSACRGKCPFCHIYSVGAPKIPQIHRSAETLFRKRQKREGYFIPVAKVIQYLRSSTELGSSFCSERRNSRGRISAHSADLGQTAILAERGQHRAATTHLPGIGRGSVAPVGRMTPPCLTAQPARGHST